MRILVLDDDPERHAAFEKALAAHKVYHVHDVEEAIIALADNPRFDTAFLDHDLNCFRHVAGVINQVELTGLHVANFIVGMEPERRPFTVIVHSWNPDGAHAMMAVLQMARVNAYKWEFHPEMRGLQIP